MEDSLGGDNVAGLVLIMIGLTTMLAWHCGWLRYFLPDKDEIDIDDDLNNATLMNWLKGIRVMEITDEAIRPFVEEEITNFHNNIISTSVRTCGFCKSTKARQCPLIICSNITSNIELNHRFYPRSLPSYRNSQIKKWLSDPWEIAKCYMPLSKDLEGLPGSNVDISSLLNVVINNKHFDGIIKSVDMTNTENIFCKGRTARNNAMHSRSHQMKAKCLKRFCDIFIDIVNEIGTDKAEHLRKIEKVRDTPLSITAEDIVGFKEQAARYQGLTEAEIEVLVKKWMEEVTGTSLIPSFVEGCQRSFCTLTKEHIQRQNPERTSNDNWTIAKFLECVYILKERKYLSGRHSKMLFPSSGSHFDIENWDIYLYCFVLNIKLYQTLDNGTLLFLKEAKVLRDDLLHKPSAVDKSKLLNLFECLDHPIKDDILMIFEKEPKTADMTHANNVLQSWKKDEEMESTSRMLEDYKRVLQVLEQVQEEISQFKKVLDECSVAKLISRVKRLETQTAIGYNTSYKPVGDLNSGLEQLETQTPDVDNTSYEQVTHIEVIPTNVSAENRHILENTITVPLEHDRVMEENGGKECSENLAGGTIESVEKGSIILKVSFPSIKSLFGFWEGCTDGTVVKAMYKIRDAYRKHLGCDALEFDIVLKKEEVSRCIDLIIGDLNSGLEQLERQTADVDKTSYKTVEDLISRVERLERQTADKDKTPYKTDKRGISAEQRANAKRMTKIFFQIADNLSREKLIEINEIINNAGKYSNDEKEFHQNLRRFFELVTYNSMISVNLLNQGIRSLLMIQNVPELGDAVSEPIREHLVKEFPTLAGMGKIDEKSLQIYLEALEQGEERLNHIRLMVVGMFGVGKTSLVRRLRGESIDDVESTEGIDVNVKVCALNEDGSWINQTPEESKDSKFDERLSEAVRTLAQPSTSYRTSERPNMKQQSFQQETETQFQTPTYPDPSLQKFEQVKKRLENLSKTNEGKKYVEHVQEATTKDTYSLRKPTISIWDFAGQSVYYSTHHFFLSSRSIYLLLLDISRPLESKVKETEDNSLLILEGSMKKDYTCLDAFKFWVTSIYAYTQYRVEKGQQYKPSIVLVGTHGDLLDPKEREQKKDNFFVEAKGHFLQTPVAKLFYPKTFLVSCKDDAENVFNNLKKNITKIAKEQPYWDSPTPAKWIPLERSIECEKRNKKELMTIRELAGANANDECNPSGVPEIKLFLQMQHLLGNMIYFDTIYLDRTFILDTQWLINIFKKFVTHKPSVPDKLRKFWRDYRKTAKLHKELLEYITETDGNNESVVAVRYMEHLDVIVKPISEEAVNFHIVPCVLKQLTQGCYDNNIKKLINPEEGKTTNVLCFVFNDGCLPPSVFHRLLATYIKKMPIKKRGEELVLYNGFGAFELTSNKTLFIWYADFIIYARVTLQDVKTDILLSDECMAVRKELSVTITNIMHLDQQNQEGSSDLKMANRIDYFTEHILCEKAFLNSTFKVLQSTNKFYSKAGLYEVKEMEPSADYNCNCSQVSGHCINRNMASRYWYEEPDYLGKVSKWSEKNIS